MRPILLALGPVTVYSYGLMLTLGIVAALAVIRPRAGRIGLGEERVYNLAALVMVAALAGARLTYIALSGMRVNEAFQLGHGGLSFFGGLVFGLAVFAVLARHWRIAFLDLTDAAVPGLALGEAVTRIGCDIFGKPTAAWWGVWHAGLIVHPVQLYAFALNLLIYLILTRFRPRRAGQTTAIYLMLLGAARFLVEFFRQGTAITGPFTWGHIAAVFAALAGLGIYAYGSKRKAMIGGRRLLAYDFVSLVLVPVFFLFR